MLNIKKITNMNRKCVNGLGIVAATLSTIGGTIGGIILLYQPKVGANHPNSITNQRTGSPKIPHGRIRANATALWLTVLKGKLYKSYQSPANPNVYHVGGKK